MPKGGARMGSGPPPNPQSRRQTGSQAGSWTDLPVEGRGGPVPVWPLGGYVDAKDEARSDTVAAQERTHWVAAWSTPQAVVWERLGWLHDVALYCRWLALAEQGDMKAAGEARQWSDRLGLNPAAMLRNRWRVVADEVEQQRTTKTAVTRTTRRLKVVDDAVARG